MISCHFPTDNRFAPKIKEAGILLSSALCVGFWIRIRASRSPVGCSFFPREMVQSCTPLESLTDLKI